MIEPELASTLCNYRIIKPISQGGFSRVFLLESQTDNASARSQYAAKVFKKASFFKLFLHELAMLEKAEASQHTQHLHEAIIDKGYLILITHYIEGITLKKQVDATGGLSQKETWHIAKKLCSAVAQLHRLGMTHGDIKPSNLLLSPSHRGVKLWLTDLGCAGQQHTEAWQGDFSFSAPDVFLCRYSNKADSYSIGLTLLYCLTGSLPWIKQKSPDASKVLAHCQIPAPIPKGLHPELNTLLCGLLHKQPRKRWSTRKAKHFLAKSHWPHGATQHSALKAPSHFTLSATESYRDAAKMGIPYAQFRYATELEQQGDTANAARWYHRAATRGFSRAMNNLGVIHEKQSLLPQANEWYLRAAQQNNAHGCFNLALSYDAKGTPDTIQRAKRLYQRAANYGHERALNRLGIAAERAEKHRQAFEHYLRAAYSGYAPAQFNLARYFGSQLNCPLWPHQRLTLIQSDTQASCRFWLTEAANNGHKRAAALLEKMDQQAEDIPEQALA